MSVPPSLPPPSMCVSLVVPCGVRRQVVGVYSGRQWALIEEHLADALGRQERDAGDAPAAVQHFMSMLACPQNNLYCQKLYLRQFMETLQQAEQQLVSNALAHNYARTCGGPCHLQLHPVSCCCYRRHVSSSFLLLAKVWA